MAKDNLILCFAIIFYLCCPGKVSGRERGPLMIAKENLFTVNTGIDRFSMNFAYTRAIHLGGNGGIVGLLYSAGAGFIPENKFNPRKQLVTKADIIGHSFLFFRLGAGLQHNTDFRESYLYFMPKLGIGFHYINLLVEFPVGLNKNGIEMSKLQKNKESVYINVNIPFDLQTYGSKWRTRVKK